MKYLVFQFSFFFLLIMLSTTVLAQTDTRIVVRAKSKDAKFIGTSMGGALVIIRDARSGNILASGTTKGTTGNTDLIMRQPQERGKSMVTPETSGYEATIPLSEPTFVTIEVQAPVNKRQAAVSAQTQLWLIPGKDIAGDGIIVEIPGMVIDVLSPQTHEVMQLEDGQRQIEIKANVVMMCGCPISEGGLWDTEKLEVKAIVTHSSGQSREVELPFTGKTSTFAADMLVEQTGSYEVTVYAYNIETGNTGVDKTYVVVR
jgi:hypothetical protein